jgi:hypothetical protein
MRWQYANPLLPAKAINKRLHLFAYMQESATEDKSMPHRFNCKSPGKFFLTVFLIPLWGCGAASNKTSPQESELGVNKRGPILSSLPSPVDKSFTSIEYIQKGMPAYDRDWSGEDMVSASNVLTSIANEDLRQLPRYRSERSGEVFARIISPENLSIFQNGTLPLRTRLSLVSRHIAGLNQISKLYLKGLIERATDGREGVELLGAVLRTAAVMGPILDEFLPTLDRNDPSYKTRMAGLEKMKKGMAEIVAGGLQTLTDRETYRTEDLIRAASLMKETFPRILAKVTPGSRLETLVRLENLAKDPDLKDLEPAIRELFDVVKDIKE